MNEGPGPVLYLPHGGGPLPVLGDPAHQPLTRFLREVPARLGEPAAILVVSAHWETQRATLTGGEAPALIYDYYGFPPESYEFRYAAPGAPALAERVRGLLEAAGIAAAVDPGRGFDHGLFVPLMLMYPEARIPCLQMSMLASLDPAAHVAMGAALAPLREEGVLVLGSGLSFHNLEVFFSPLDPAAEDPSEAFDDWLLETCAGPGLSPAEREGRLVHWEQAPHARYCHPREEHLLPLQVCYGAAAAATPVAEVAFNGRLYGRKVSGLLW